MPTRSIQSLALVSWYRWMRVGEVVGAVVEPAERDQQERGAQLGVQLLDRAGGDLGAAAVAEQHHGYAAVGLVTGEPELVGDLGAHGAVVQGTVPAVGGDEDLHDVVQEQHEPDVLAEPFPHRAARRAGRPAGE